MTSLIEDLKTDIRAAEGKRSFVYDDATGLPIKPGSYVRGNPTVGYGRALNVRGLSNDEIETFLETDCCDAINWCNGNLVFFGTLSERRQRAVANMVYQLGGAGFSRFLKLIKALQNSDWQTAHDEIINSLYDKETPNRALNVANAILNG